MFRAVIFLDIDGVLNSADYMRNRRHIRRPTPHAIDALAVPRLNAIIERTGAKIVISSSWRKGKSVERLREIFAAHGIVGEIIGKTRQICVSLNDPEFPHGVKEVERGIEIQAWLDEHGPVESFIIIDDESDMAHLKYRLVQTSWEFGLCDGHVEKAVALMAKPV